MRKVRVGLVGCGLMGQMVHLPNFMELPDCEVVAIADVRERLVRQLAAKYQIPKACCSHQELAADPEIDAVVITTQDDLHAPMAAEFAKAGKHILLEKPLATNLDDATLAVEAAERAGVVFMLSLMKRYDPGVEIAKNLIDTLRRTGELGQILFARCHCFGGDWIANIGAPATTDESFAPPPKTAPHWLHPDRIDEFRVFNCCYCHNMSLLRHLAGEVSSVEHVHFNHHSKVAILNMGSFPATLEFSFMRAHFWDEETKIYFADGWVEVKTPPPLLRNVSAHVEVYRGAHRAEFGYPKASWEWSFKRVAQDFLTCVRTGAQPLTSGRDALRDMALLEEIFGMGLKLRVSRVAA